MQSGVLRIGHGLRSSTTATRNPASGELKGIALELGRALAARIGIKLVSIEYPRPGAVIDGLRTGAWDVSVLLIDPVRAEQMDFQIHTWKLISPTWRRRVDNPNRRGRGSIGFPYRGRAWRYVGFGFDPRAQASGIGPD